MTLGAFTALEAIHQLIDARLKDSNAVLLPLNSSSDNLLTQPSVSILFRLGSAWLIDIELRNLRCTFHLLYATFSDRTLRGGRLVTRWTRLWTLRKE